MPNVWVDNNHSVGTQFEENIWTKQRFTFCTVDDQLSSENTKKYYFYVRVPYIKYIDYIIQFMMKWRKNKILMYIIYGQFSSDGRDILGLFLPLQGLSRAYK